MTALKWLTPFAILEILICVLHFSGIAEATLFAMINVVNFVFILLPGSYYLTMFFVFKNKCESATPVDGVIANWEAGFFRYTGAVILKVDDKELEKEFLEQYKDKWRVQHILVSTQAQQDVEHLLRQCLTFFPRHHATSFSRSFIDVRYLYFHYNNDIR